MKNVCVFVAFLITGFTVRSQKLYGIVNLTVPYSGISYTEKYNREEFKPSIPRFNLTWKFELVMPSKSMSHKISFEEVPFEKQFKITNKFFDTPGDTLTFLGVRDARYATAIDLYVLGYSIQKEGKKYKKFLFGIKMKYNHSAGFGISLNRSKEYYSKVYSKSSGGFQSQESYIKYEAIHHRDGIGLFLKGSGGIDFFNKKGKRRLCASVFYSQGLKEIAHFNMHYAYGYFHDPAKQVDVPIVLRSRGTTFGFSVGVPITILK